MQRAHVLLLKTSKARIVLTSGHSRRVVDFRIARESKLEEDVHGKVASLPAPSSGDREKIDTVKALTDTVELVVMRVIRSVLTKECASEFLAFGRAPLEA